MYYKKIPITELFILISELNLHILTETCPDISAPLSGSVAFQTDGSVTTATFSCLSREYYIDGQRTLTCQPDGTWNYAEPLCGKSNLSPK